MAKLLAGVVAAGAIGVLLGVGLAALTGDDDVPPPAALGTGATTAATTPPTTPATSSVPAATATGTTPRASPSSALAKARVRLLGTVLHGGQHAVRHTAACTLRFRPSDPGRSHIRSARRPA